MLAFLRKLAAVAVTLASAFKNVKFPNAKTTRELGVSCQLIIFEDST